MDSDDVIDVPSEDEQPFRALDLVDGDRQEVPDILSGIETPNTGNDADFDFDPSADGPDLDDSFIHEFQLVKQDSHVQSGEQDAFSLDEDADVAVPLPVETVVNDATLASSQWNFLVAANFSQYRGQHQGMQFPWEQGVYADIFGDGHGLDFPVCAGLAEKEGVVGEVQTQELLTSSMGDLPVDAKFVGVVSATKDLDYFEENIRSWS